MNERTVKTVLDETVKSLPIKEQERFSFLLEWSRAEERLNYYIETVVKKPSFGLATCYDQAPIPDKPVGDGTV